MKNFINALRNNDARTTNGMATHSTSLNKNLDLFFLAGASRKMSENDITALFAAAYAENKELALKTLFWARDIRGGAGERRFFRIAMTYLATLNDGVLDRNVQHISEYGRWDDLFTLDGTHLDGDVLNLIRKGLYEDRNGLLAKWLPRKGPFANKVRKHLELTPRAYRKLLVELSDTVEQRMCARKFDLIAYPRVPSVAMNKYRKAFFRNDETRYTAYIASVQKGEAKINADAIFPHTLFQAIQKDRPGKMKDAIVAQWNALPNYMANSTEKILPVCDVSGSMTGLPMDVSVSLGIYISERNESVFKDAFMTFSATPKLQYLKGDLYQRVNQLLRADWGMNTNLEAVFNLVLNKAKAAKLPASEMPTKLLIISDMEFDVACNYNQNALEMIEDHYKRAGYRRPGIVFWNVNGRTGNVPAKVNAKNVALVSGFSPAILKTVLNGGDTFTPLGILKDTVMAERYARIRV
ncbi:MAG: DUF2828 family protein [Bacteroidota bacterium]